MNIYNLFQKRITNITAKMLKTTQKKFYQLKYEKRGAIKYNINVYMYKRNDS